MAGASLTTKPLGPGLDGAPQESGAPEGGDDEDPRGRQPLQEPRGRAQPVSAGHVDVHKNDVGPVLERDGQNIVPVSDLGDDLDVGFQGEQRGQRPAHHGLVIGQHHSDHRSSPSLVVHLGLVHQQQRMGYATGSARRILRQPRG